MLLSNLLRFSMFDECTYLYICCIVAERWFSSGRRPLWRRGRGRLPRGPSPALGPPSGLAAALLPLPPAPAVPGSGPPAQAVLLSAPGKTRDPTSHSIIIYRYIEWCQCLCYCFATMFMFCVKTQRLTGIFYNFCETTRPKCFLLVNFNSS